MNERWLAVIGYEGTYEVSDMGRVRSVDRTIKSGRRFEGRMLRVFGNNHGYANVHLSREGQAKLVRVHTLVLEAFVGPRPAGAIARHFPNADKMDNRLSNLQWGTQEENEADKEDHGSKVRGERHWSAKLNEAQVTAIRAMVRDGVRQKSVAEIFGVSPQTVNMIALGKTWAHQGSAA